MIPRPKSPPAPGLPFAEHKRPANLHVANVDGGSRGNPGPAAYGLIVRDPSGATVFEIGKYIGRTTNNVAEYYGLIAALDYAVSQGFAGLRVISDSELMVRQMQGRYKVKSADLRPLYERAHKLARSLGHFAIEHVLRDRNSEADALANLALDRTSGRGSTALAPPPESSAPAPARPASASPSATPAAASPTGRLASDAARPPHRGGEQRVRALYRSGALHPLETIDGVAEGAIVELRVIKNSD